MATKREGFFGTDNLHRALWTAIIGVIGFLGVLMYQKVFGPQKVVVEALPPLPPSAQVTTETSPRSEEIKELASAIKSLAKANATSAEQKRLREIARPATKLNPPLGENRPPALLPFPRDDVRASRPSPAPLTLPWPKTAVVRRLTPDNGKDIWTTSIYSYAPGSSGPGGGLDNEILRVGGWGDYYFALVMFELEGLPKRASSAAIYLYAIPDSTPVSMYVDRITSSWDWAPGDRLWWVKRPKADLGTLILPAPPQNGWYHIDVTELYNAWQEGAYPNFGIQLRPTSVNNKFNKFISSNDLRNSALRPALVIQ